MQTNDPTKIQNPPPLPSQPSRFAFSPLEKPANVSTILDALLKTPGRVIHALQEAGGNRILALLCGISIICLLLYGTVAGSLSGGTQLWAAPAKITLGMFISAVICLPSLYIFTCLNGANTSFRCIAGSLAAAVCLISLLLVGFAPVVWVFSQSTESLVFMGILNFAFFAVGAYFALPIISAANRFAGASNGGHIGVWTFIFAIVCLQMTTALRPILGTSEDLLPKEKRFFLVHWSQVAAGSREVDSD